MNQARPGDTSFLGLRSLRRFRKNPMTYLSGLARDHGDIAYFRLGPIEAALINGPELVREILVTQIDDFPKIGRQRSTIRRMDGNSLFVKNGHEWLADRRVIQAAIHPNRMKEYAEKLVLKTQHRMTDWSHDAVVNFEDEMIELAILIMGSVFFDADLEPHCESLRHGVYERSRLFMKEMSALVSIPDSWPLPYKRAKRRLIRKMDDLIYGIIAQKKSQGLVGNDMVTRLLRMADDTREGHQQVRDHVNMLYQAAADDVSCALVWMFYLIAKNPEAQENLVNEVNEVIGAENITFADLPQLNFLQGVVKESLRMYPATWVFTARKARRDVQVGGHEIKHKTWVFVSPYVTQRDPRFFENPETFEPERFLPNPSRPFPKNAYFPFGMGPRACAASNLSLMMLSLIAATVTQKFRLELAPGLPQIEPVGLVTVRPSTGIRLRLHERAASKIRAA